jgi:hypothetical protein
MSAHETYEGHELHESPSFIDTYWQLFLIAFALCFVSLLLFFTPTV